ncbi:hypothetical protein ACQ4WX_00585 [Streptomyces lasalocidi]
MIGLALSPLPLGQKDADCFLVTFHAHCTPVNVNYVSPSESGRSWPVYTGTTHQFSSSDCTFGTATASGDMAET